MGPRLMSRLETKLLRLNPWRAAWLDELQALPPDKLMAAPRLSKWSILEIVEHLAVSERVVLQGLPDPSLLVERPRRLKHRFRYLLVEDTFQPEQNKRWVVVAPPGST